jgi:hypothetical protein
VNDIPRGIPRIKLKGPNPKRGPRGLRGWPDHTVHPPNTVLRGTPHQYIPPKYKVLKYKKGKWLKRGVVLKE